MEHLKDKSNNELDIPRNKRYFSPGRVNLIGEHIDYNGGHVMPFAISRGITGIIWFTEDKKTVSLKSTEFHELGLVSFDLDNFEKTNDFSDYVKGVIYVLKEDYMIDLPYGFTILFSSTLPKCSGLSSSAALEVLVAHMINDEFNLGFSKEELAVIAQKAENKYVNVNCGIMDQFAVSCGLKDNAIFLDTNTLEYEYVPFKLNDAILLVINTNKPRSLINSKYNERRAECEEALKLLGKETLCSASLDDIVDLPETLKKRARHAITEEMRVQAASIYLQDGNMKKLGELLNESHNSLRYDYEVTGLELDTIVDLLNESEFCLGARMTGAGFGGCAIALFNNNIPQKEFVDFMIYVRLKYKDATGLNLTYDLLTPEDGTKELK